jgi:acyl-CoA thioester hydrolase
MGVVYHARYAVWLDIARTEHLRSGGLSYKALEERGLRLAVSELRIRYRQPARYDDEVRVQCWVREVGSRRITFGYALSHAVSGLLLATAETSLLCLKPDFTLTRMPHDVLALLEPAADPVPL